MKSRLYSRVYWLALILAVACKEKYTPPAITANNSKFLVVEGYISLGNVATTITLTHTKNINSDSSILPENGAAVSVQSDDGGVYTLNEQGNGVYTIGEIDGSTTAKYRLAITTTDGNQFLSDYISYKPTPFIDSISWEQHSDGVHIYANTHDDAGASKYYKWDYVETYEYHAPYNDLYKVVNNVIEPRTPDEQVFTCWRSLPSTGIFIASTTKLSQDVIYKSPLVYIPTSTQKLGVLYSILVTQHVLSADGYNYWQQLSKNTENLGSLFDAQPSQLQGNIHCTNDPSVVAVGFITASGAQQQRIFIAKNQLTDWRYPPDPTSICDTVHLNDENMAHYIATGYIPVDFYGPYLYYATLPVCADCTEQGGVTVKPPFWP